MRRTAPAPAPPLLGRVGWALVVAGTPGVAVAAVLAPGGTAAAARQDWPPFVLVTGLLALGLVAREDGLFEASGHVMAGAARGGRFLLLRAAVPLPLVPAGAHRAPEGWPGDGSPGGGRAPSRRP